MDIGLLVLSLAVPTLLGWKILEVFLSDKNVFFLLERILFAYGLGFGCITLSMFYLSLLGLSFYVHLIIFLFLICLLVVHKHRPKELTGTKQLSLVAYSGNIFTQPLSLFMLLFIAVNIFILFLRTMLIDVDMWDSWAFWAFKAKIFYHHKIIPLEIFPKFKEVWGNWDYPLHVPLMETWILLWVGYWNDLLPRIIFPLFYTGICIVGFSFLRRHVSLRAALAGTCFFASLRGLQIYTIGTIAEPVLLFYYLASFVLLDRWREKGDDRFLILSAVFAGIMLWTKSEALILVGGNIFFILFFIAKNQDFKKILLKVAWYIFIVVIIIAPWNLFKVATNIENVAFNKNYLQLAQIPNYITRLKTIPQVFCYHFFNLPVWNILWLLMGFACAYNVKFQKNKIATPILFIIFFEFIVCALGYVTISWGEEVFVYDTMNRLMIAPALLAILYSSLILFGQTEKERLSD